MIVIVALLAFGIALLVAVLLSKTASRTPLSTEVIFLAAGFLFGRGALNLIQVDTTQEIVFTFVEMALFSVLFSDGLKIGIHDLLSAWHLPGRTLLLGLPLTLFGIAILAHLVLRLGWLESLLVGAVLSPTDPVFTKALVSRQEVPLRLRQLLNVESGLNDGLALPVVLTILAFIGVEELEIARWIAELLAGVALGIGIPWLILSLLKTHLFSVTNSYKPLLCLSIGVLVFALAQLFQVNLFLAAFSAGITAATVEPDLRRDFREYAEPLAELLKLGAVLVFGALLTWGIFTRVGLRVYIYAILVLFLARPIALGLALIKSALDWRERAAAAWFGPRGFASVVYGLLVLGSGAPRSAQIFQSIAIVIVASMLAHSTTDVLVARWFQKHEAQADLPAQENELLLETERGEEF